MNKIDALWTLMTYVWEMNTNDNFDQIWNTSYIVTHTWQSFILHGFVKEWNEKEYSLKWSLWSCVESNIQWYPLVSSKTHMNHILEASKYNNIHLIPQSLCWIAFVDRPKPAPMPSAVEAKPQFHRCSEFRRLGRLLKKIKKQFYLYIIWLFKIPFVYEVSFHCCETCWNWDLWRILKSSANHSEGDFHGTMLCGSWFKIQKWAKMQRFTKLHKIIE